MGAIFGVVEVDRADHSDNLGGFDVERSKGDVVGTVITKEGGAGSNGGFGGLLGAEVKGGFNGEAPGTHGRVTVFFFKKGFYFEDKMRGENVFVLRSFGLDGRDNVDFFRLFGFSFGDIAIFEHTIYDFLLALEKSFVPGIVIGV